jgi:spore photoproduct lyase
VNPYLVETFAELKNATLELKTKTDDVSSLIGLNHRQNTVIAWSLNPPDIVRHHEFKTASLENRLSAARKVIDNGYGVAFHFDPIIFYPEWEAGYRETIEMLFDRIPAQKIAWISLGTLRYIPMLKKIAEERFPALSIFANEFTAAHDGKMRYLKPIRKQLIGTLSGWIRSIAPKVPLYICMEKHSVWKNIMNPHPKCAEDLERYLNTNTPSKTGDK